ncbi:MAG: DUF47 family protein [Desulfobulbaceae bacterium]|nr:DUF47 family protein [Desulfobulbaceae bacterium]
MAANKKKYLKMIAGVRRSEHNIDSILFRAQKALFENEKGMNPISIIFWYQLTDLLGRISDQAENVGDRLLLLISK